MSCIPPRWKHLKGLLQNLGPEEFFKALEQTPGALSLDVRGRTGPDSGPIPGAIQIDFLAGDFWERLDQLDKEAVYFVFCDTGHRSVRVCTYMRNSGFNHVYNLEGGLDNSAAGNGK